MKFLPLLHEIVTQKDRLKNLRIKHCGLHEADRPAILRGNVHGREIGNGLCESGAVGVEFLHEGAHFLGLAHPLQALRMGGGGDE